MTSAHREPDQELSGPAVVDAAELPDETGETVDWTSLPEAVRMRLAEIAADAVGEIPAIDIPPPVRPVAKFAPAKRARLGAAPLLGALRNNTAFRTSVTEWAREHRPAVLDLTAPDPAVACAAALLLADGAAGHYVELVRRRAGDAALRSERDAAVQRAARAEAELQKVRAELDLAAGNAGQAAGVLEAELDKLLKRLRD